MSTLVLGTAGRVVGGMVGGPIGALIGGAIGSIAGSYIDGMLFPQQQGGGSRLSDLNFAASSEGAAISRVFGKMRVNPQIIWATKYKESKGKAAGKGAPTAGSGGGEQYKYSCSFALGLCEGEITGLGRVWADGKIIKLSDYTTRLYTGTETQSADPKILAVEGADKAPGFRGLAYLVLEDMPLEKFGNRVPQITVEVIRQGAPTGPQLETLGRGVTLIPGTTEFGYATTKISKIAGVNESASENAQASASAADIVVALDNLQAEMPEVEHVSLVVAWHGDDLRCGSCLIKPRVEVAGKNTKPWVWQVGPVTRGSAVVVSQIGGNPAVGGAPSDRSIYEAITEIKARGLKCTLYPFIMMDIPAGNVLPNPYSANAASTGQSAYPWRGRITCSPAPGYTGTVDKTATASTQVAAFFGSVAASSFGWDSTAKHVTYAGSGSDWGFRRFILHMAQIADAAGGVDAFLIGSELVGLTTVRSSASAYPAVAQMISLAAEVRTLVGGDTLISYAADWSEYHSHRPGDGSGDVYFPLDALWMNANIDFIGIDNYLPLSDWRDGTAHLDAQLYASIYDLDYLQSNIEGGEYFDWYYSDDTARNNQTRTTITDGIGKPWVYRNKDLRAWWLNSHYPRPAGVQSVSASAWVPQSKPIVFTELGCPAIDKGSNQPNVFVDPKSSESNYPHFSSGRRDDLIQRCFLEAHLDYWHPDAGNNPISSVYAGPMIAWDRVYLWTWDARPYPEFPQNFAFWSDAENWSLGHWLNGRLGQVRLRDIVVELTAGLGITVDASTLTSIVRGYLIDALQSPRESLQPLGRAFFFDATESGGTILFRPRGREVDTTYDRQMLALREGSEGDYTLTRAQESELPRALKLKFYVPDADYRQGSVGASRLIGNANAIVDDGLAIALPYPEAQGIADGLLQEAHVARERAAFTLPPSALALDAGDVVALDVGGRTFRFKLDQLGYEPSRPVTAVREDQSVYDLVVGPDIVRALPRPRPPAPPLVHFMDMPLLRDEDEPQAHAPRAASYSGPWSPTAFYRAAEEGQTLALDSIFNMPASMGVLTAPLLRGPVWVWDNASELVVEVAPIFTLASVDDSAVLNGANACAVQVVTDIWEIIQFVNAELIGPNTYRLTRLLRGQRGSEADMVDAVPVGAAFVLLDEAVAYLDMPVALRGVQQYWRWGPSFLPPTDPLYDGADKTFYGIGLRPYAPVHIAGEASGGDIVLSWVRRTRVGGGDFDADEVPISEQSEAYEIDIYDGPDVVRTLTATASTVTYTAAMQSADFGGAQTTLDVAIYQMSASFGRGSPGRATITI